MAINVDDMTAVERPRKRRFAIVAAIVVPIVALAGASAWFIRTFVMPATVSVAAAPQTAQLAEPPSETASQSETTGSSPPTASGTIWPSVPTSAPRSVWDSVPLPGPPRQTQDIQREPAAFAEPAPAGESVALPLPPPRPQIAAARTNGAVPLPRPRPPAGQN